MFAKSYKGALVVASCLFFLTLLCTAATAAAGDHSGDSNGEGHLSEKGDERYTVLATADGTQLIRASDYRNGITAGSKGGNFIIPCGNFDSQKGNFVLRVTMGEFTDYILPDNDDVTVCEVLTSKSVEGKYRWSASDPMKDTWDGYSVPVGLASQWENALGGAPLNFLAFSTADSAVDRSTIAFWGFDDEELDSGGAEGKALLGHKGGCCASTPHESPSWYQRFQIAVSGKLDEEALYLVLASQPAAVVMNAPVMFMAKIWNFRGEPQKGNPSFTVNLNGMKTVHEASQNGRSTLVFESDLGASEFADLVEGQSFTLTVSTASSDKLASSRASVSLSLPVHAPYGTVNSALRPFRRDSGVSQMLHFGPANFVIAPVSRFSAFDNDWFAGASLSTSGAGGEAFLRPVEDHAGVAQADPSLPSSTETWTKVSSNNSEGSFVGRYSLGTVGSPDAEANGTLQFYAFTLYSTAVQEVVMQITVSEAFSLFIGHEEVEPPAGSAKQFSGDDGTATTRITFSRYLDQGYHQILIKLFSSQAQVNNEVHAALTFKAYGTGIAYTLEPPLEMPDSSYEMTSNSYMYYLLSNGESATDMLYADSIDQDLVGVHGVAPRSGEAVVTAGQLKTENGVSDPNARRRWHSAVFYGGNIPVDGSNIPANRNYAVKYVALALYNQYDTDITVAWQLIVKGHSEMYMDGVLQYAAPEGAEKKVRVETALTPGWHQLVVRLATPRDNTWVFRFYMHFVNYRLIGALQVQQSHVLPFGIRVIQDGVPLQAMLELTAKDRPVTSDKFAAMLAYNASNATESAIGFLHQGIELFHGSNAGASTVGEPQSVFAYSTETVSLSTTNASGLIDEWEWVPTTKLQDGLWGTVSDDKLSGGYYRLWAFSLYAAETMDLLAKLDFVGGYALWVDGVLRGSESVTAANTGRLQAAQVTVKSVTAGWHQAILKLQVPSTFQLTEVKETGGAGLGAWTDAVNVCVATYGSAFKTCPSQAYCPFGAPRVGVALPLTPEDASRSPNIYAPVSDAENQFIQVAAAVAGAAKAPQPVCSTASITVVGENNLTAYGVGTRIGCCESIRTPFIAVKFHVAAETAGKVGYAYHELVAIAAPTITRTAPYRGRQTVTITVDNEEADIRYRLSDGEAWTAYKAPFNLTHVTTVQAQAYLGSRTSEISRLVADVPGVVSFDRSECLYDAPCPLVFTGANLGNLASLVARDQPPKTVQLYADVAYARAQKQCSLFSGVTTMDDASLTATLRVTAPVTSASSDHDVAQYVVMVYDEINGTQEGYVKLQRSLSLKPKTVAADSVTLFAADTYVREADIVLFPQLHKAVDSTGKSLDTIFAEKSCTSEHCVAAFRHYGSTNGSSVTSARTFEADLSATQRTSLTCMCVCAACHKRLHSGLMDTATFDFHADRVAALPIQVQVLRTTCNDHNQLSNTTIGLCLAFCILSAILVLGSIVFFLTRFVIKRCRGPRAACSSRHGTAVVVDSECEQNSFPAFNDEITSPLGCTNSSRSANVEKSGVEEYAATDDSRTSLR